MRKDVSSKMFTTQQLTVWASDLIAGKPLPEEALPLVAKHPARQSGLRKKKKKQKKGKKEIGPRYAFYGKPVAKIKQADGTKKKVKKKYHIVVNGMTVCKVEHNYKSRKQFTFSAEPPNELICQNCVNIEKGDKRWDEPRLSVLMGESME